MSTSPPSTLGKYQIIREIARSNDIVYEAYDPLMNRRVAIKELAVPSASTAQQKEERVKRFQREVKAAGSLAHPHIVTIYEVGEDAGRHYMAMEFLDGHTLRNEIDTHGFLPPDRAVEIAMAVLDALDFAHNNGVVHRDIKPDNIQLLSDGRVKLTDFGIARLTFEPNLTMDGQVFGTPSYMSPEQVVGKEIDARSDVFGIGVVLYEMIGGQKPFTGDNVITITHAITHKHPDQPKQASHSLWRVIEKALDKTPAMRFSSAKEMREALQRVADEMKSGAVVLGQAPPPIANQYPNALPICTQPYAPQPPPAQYAYNPYMPPAPVNYTPYQPTGQGLPQVPIYYPPPPRRPMVSQETKETLVKLLLTALILALLFALIISGIIALAQTQNRPRPAGETSSRTVEDSPSTNPYPAAHMSPPTKENTRGLYPDLSASPSTTGHQSSPESGDLDSGSFESQLNQLVRDANTEEKREAAVSFIEKNWVSRRAKGSALREAISSLRKLNNLSEVHRQRLDAIVPQTERPS